MSRLAAIGTMSSAGRASTSVESAQAPRRPIPWRESLKKRWARHGRNTCMDDSVEGDVDTPVQVKSTAHLLARNTYKEKNSLHPLLTTTTSQY